MAAQISDLTVFDFLTANPDRYSGGNMKMSADGEQLFFMDNTMSFFVEPEGEGEEPRGAVPDAAFFARALRGARPHHVPTLERALAQEPGAAYEILTPAEIPAVVARRQIVRSYIAELIAQFGAKSVLFFP